MTTLKQTLKPGYMTTEIMVTLATLWAIYKTVGAVLALEGGCSIGVGHHEPARGRPGRRRGAPGAS